MTINLPPDLYSSKLIEDIESAINFNVDPVTYINSIFKILLKENNRSSGCSSEYIKGLRKSIKEGQPASFGNLSLRSFVEWLIEEAKQSAELRDTLSKVRSTEYSKKMAKINEDRRKVAHGLRDSSAEIEKLQKAIAKLSEQIQLQNKSVQKAKDYVIKKTKKKKDTVSEQRAKDELAYEVSSLLRLKNERNQLITKLKTNHRLFYTSFAPEQLSMLQDYDIQFLGLMKEFSLECCNDIITTMNDNLSRVENIRNKLKSFPLEEEFQNYVKERENAEPFVYHELEFYNDEDDEDIVEARDELEESEDLKQIIEKLEKNIKELTLDIEKDQENLQVLKTTFSLYVSENNTGNANAKSECKRKITEIECKIKLQTMTRQQVENMLNTYKSDYQENLRNEAAHEATLANESRHNNETESFVSSFVDTTSSEVQAPPQTQIPAVALFEYQTTKEDELAFTEGEHLFIITPNQDGWHYGKNSKGKLGYIPANYVQLSQ